MAFEKTKQSLASIEDKLRRAFKLAGPIGAKLDPTLTGVFIVDDLRAPGHAFFDGRSWVWCSTDIGTPVGVSCISLQPAVDVLVEAVWISGTMTLGAAMELYITTPGETPAQGAVGGTNVAWRDRKMVTLDAPPFAGGSNWSAVTGTLIALNNRMYVWRCGTASQVDDVREMQIMIPAGGALNWRSSSAFANLQVGCWGRVFP